MKFFDNVKIYVQAGNGGNGCCSFRREKFVPFGGPDGGNGGNGGNIILITNNNLNTLLHLHFQVHHRAKSGQGGMGQNKYGANAEDVILEIPIGTQIFDENNNFITDLTAENQQFIIAKGGEGGVGNTMFKSSTNRAPRHFTKGTDGQCGWFILKLKLISDIGIIGLPNAGKSSFLCKVTNAKSKIGDYPFTTTKPILGVLKKNKKGLVLCDIPGLIEGASDGIGLGDQFLQHIERCKSLLHIIDCTSENLLADYKIIRKELKHYNKSLLDKSEIIVLNKIDTIENKILNKKILQFNKFLNKKNKDKIVNVFPISTITGEGIKDLLKAIFDF